VPIQCPRRIDFGRQVVIAWACQTANAISFVIACRSRRMAIGAAQPTVLLNLK
jgi:hypothetical protein